MREKWGSGAPVYGGQIRVDRGGYFHHGIYINDGEVVHFGGQTASVLCGAEPPKVRITTLEEFLEGKYPEVRIYSLLERLKRFSPAETVERARARVGEGGYDLVSNNCEHFSNYCVFGKCVSMQSDTVKSGANT